MASTLTAGPAAGTDGYSDVGRGGTHEPAINALAGQGVFSGTECGEGRFCPDDPIERWAMAVWLIRVLGDRIGAGGKSRFADVDASEWWSPYTEALAERKVTTGCKTNPLRYCPASSVNRGQMASFIVRAFELEPAKAAGFSDTRGNTHEAAINALAAAGITKGCGTEPLRYCPDNPVKRSQMATFLHRALLRQQAKTTEPEPIEISDDVPATGLTHITSGEAVNLRSFFTGDRGVLLWFWAPW